jgi:hypothetical protein
MICSKCGSDETQRLEVVYENGTQNINTHSTSIGVTSFGSGVGLGSASTSTSGKSQSLAAQRGAPPGKKSLKGSIATLIFGLICLFYFGGDVGLAFGIIFLVIGGVVFWIKYSYNLNKWPPLYDKWQSSWYCNKCGFIFQSLPQAGTPEITVVSAGSIDYLTEPVPTLAESDLSPTPKIRPKRNLTLAAGLLSLVAAVGGVYMYGQADAEHKAKEKAKEAAIAKAQAKSDALHMQAEADNARKAAELAKKETENIKLKAQMQAMLKEKKEAAQVKHATQQIPAPRHVVNYNTQQALLNPAPTPQRSSIEARNLLLAENARKTREANALQKPLSRDKAIVDFMK